MDLKSFRAFMDFSTALVHRGHQAIKTHSMLYQFEYLKPLQA
jgi:hypothetical protein